MRVVTLYAVSKRMLFNKNIYREYFINSEIGIIYNINIYILAYVYIAVVDFPHFLFSG